MTDGAGSGIVNQPAADTDQQRQQQPERNLQHVVLLLNPRRRAVVRIAAEPTPS